MGFLVQKVGIKVVAHKLLHSLFQLFVTGKIKDDVQLDRLKGYRNPPYWSVGPKPNDP
jgi:hypothetical protein